MQIHCTPTVYICKKKIITMSLRCDKCNKIINTGEAYHALVQTVEVQYPDEIQVLSSDLSMALCQSCGKIFNASTIKTIIRHIPVTPESISLN